MKGRAKLNKDKLFALFYFIFFLCLLTFLYLRTFRGIQGDAYYYYSYAVSILWDKDLDLTNQFDHPSPHAPDQTITGGNYFIDARTGRAFSFFNIGTGLMMLPFLAAARGVDYIRGNKNQDAFSFSYQKIACYSNIVLTSIALLLLFLILRDFFSFSLAIAMPPLFLFGTNWLFYCIFFSGWSHAYSLALTIFSLWAFLKAFQKQKPVYFALFGFLSGLVFAIRNINLVLFIFIILFFILVSAVKGGEANLQLASSAGKRNQEEKFWLEFIRKRKNIFDKKKLWLCFLASLFFLLGAFPQFYYYYLTHGSPLRSSFTAAGEALRPFFHPAADHFRVIYTKNLFLLSSTLFNSENGLFYFHPLYLLGLIGFVIFRIKRAELKIIIWALFFSVYIYWFFDAAYFDTWFCRAAGAGFGHRRFLDLLAFFILGATVFMEKMREKYLSRWLVSGLVSFLFVSSISFFHLFQKNYAGFYREKDSLVNFYAYLFKDISAKLGFLVCWAILYFLLSFKEKENKIIKLANPIKLEQPAILALILLLLFLPPLIFKRNPEWDRQRFREREGFFLLYTLTPLVKIYGKEWSLPVNLGRFLVKKNVRVVLPSPLRKGDALLFKITFSGKEKEIAIMEIWTEKVLQGRQRLNAGKNIYFFPLNQETWEVREFRVKIDYGGPARDILIHEARVIFREQSKPPFGHIDFPGEDEVLASDDVWLEGWALDDWGIDRVEIRASVLTNYNARVGLTSIQKNEEIVLAKAEFLRGNRPDVEKIFVLYPDILRCGWKAKIDRNRLPPELKNKPLEVRAVALDREGNLAELGRKLIVWKNGT